LLWLDLRAEPMVLSVPAVDKKRYYSVMLNDGNTFNYGYIGSRATGSDAGDYLVVGRELEGRNAAGHQEGVPLDHRFLARGLPHPAHQRQGHAQRREGAGGLQGQPLSAYLKQPARPPRRPSISRRSTRRW
jgi:hypothetical protein